MQNWRALLGRLFPIFLLAFNVRGIPLYFVRQLRLVDVLNEIKQIDLVNSFRPCKVIRVDYAMLCLSSLSEA